MVSLNAYNTNLKEHFKYSFFLKDIVGMKSWSGQSELTEMFHVGMLII